MMVEHPTAPRAVSFRQRCAVVGQANCRALYAPFTRSPNLPALAGSGLACPPCRPERRQESA